MVVVDCRVKALEDAFDLHIFNEFALEGCETTARGSVSSRVSPHGANWCGVYGCMYCMYAQQLYKHCAAEQYICELG